MTILSIALLLMAATSSAQSPAAGPPIGSFDTPANMTLGISGALAITGWALDNTGGTSVDIQRDAHPSDPPGAVVNGRVFIGTATFVTGARPDIASAYAAYPNATRAGWGYMMMTRGLIWDGAGPFRLYAIATDTQGNKTELGPQTISIDNAVAKKPFGNIDSPGPGAAVSGLYPVTGWVLTPNAGATIPAASVQVSIDDVFLTGVPSMSDRPDITAGFPGFNTSGAGRGLFVDMTRLLNGVHRIGWVATDSSGQADGIGSRFFTVANPTFSSGQFLIGSQMPAGRYFTAAKRGCYWERQSGLGGSFGEILANDFVGFDATQLIVDIKASDVAFKTDADCGAWSLAPMAGAQATIRPGTWLVGSQVTAGTYSSIVAAGCYWERVRDFTGGSGTIIGNSFVSSAGQQFVTISATDVGFHNDGDCGTWTRVTSLTAEGRAALVAAQAISTAAIEANRRAHRARGDRR